MKSCGSYQQKQNLGNVIGTLKLKIFCSLRNAQRRELKKNGATKGERNLIVSGQIKLYAKRIASVYYRMRRRDRMAVIKLISLDERFRSAIMVSVFG